MKVKWEMDIDAGSVRAAALEAIKTIRRYGTIATVFTVIDDEGREQSVDIVEEVAAHDEQALARLAALTAPIYRLLRVDAATCEVLGPYRTEAIRDEALRQLRVLSEPQVRYYLLTVALDVSLAAAAETRSGSAQ